MPLLESRLCILWSEYSLHPHGQTPFQLSGKEIYCLCTLQRLYGDRLLPASQLWLYHVNIYVRISTLLTLPVIEFLGCCLTNVVEYVPEHYSCSPGCKRESYGFAYTSAATSDNTYTIFELQGVLCHYDAGTKAIKKEVKKLERKRDAAHQRTKTRFLFSPCIIVKRNQVSA